MTADSKPTYTDAELETGREIVRAWSESEGRGLALSILIAKALANARSSSAAVVEAWIPTSEPPSRNGQFIGRYDTPGGVLIQPVGYNVEWGWSDSEWLTHYIPLPPPPEEPSNG